jgi:hypothetical protein
LLAPDSGGSLKAILYFPNSSSESQSIQEQLLSSTFKFSSLGA